MLQYCHLTEGCIVYSCTLFTTHCAHLNLCRSQGVNSQNTPEVHISNGSSSGLAPISAANGDCPTDTSVTPSHKTESTSIKYADLDLESQEGSVHGIKSSVKYSKVKSS